jgi:hypothetical protein
MHSRDRVLGMKRKQVRDSTLTSNRVSLEQSLRKFFPSMPEFADTPELCTGFPKYQSRARLDQFAAYIQTAVANLLDHRTAI